MTGNLCSAALPWRRIKAWNSWRLHVSCNIQKKYFSHYLFQYLKNHQGCQSWVIFSGSILKKKKKNLTRLTEERVGVDRSRLSLIVAFWVGKQRQSEDAERRGWLQCGWCCGDNKWRENPTSACLGAHATRHYKPRHITRHRQRGRMLVFRARFVKYEAETQHQCLGKSTRIAAICLSS